MNKGNPALINDYVVISNHEKIIFKTKEVALWYYYDLSRYSDEESKKKYKEIYNNIKKSNDGYDDKTDVISERKYNYDDYDNEDAIIAPAQTLSKGWYWKRYNDGSGSLISPNGNDFMQYDFDTHEYKLKSNSWWSVYSTPEEPLANKDYFLYAEKLIKSYEIDLKEKLDKFNDLCGEWDYRDIDMTMAHLQSININKNTIDISCEYYDADIDEYISCDGGNIKNKKLVDDFKNLDLTDKYETINYMNSIEDLVDWDKVAIELQNEASKQKGELGL